MPRSGSVSAFSRLDNWTTRSYIIAAAPRTQSFRYHILGSTNTENMNWISIGNYRLYTLGLQEPEATAPSPSPSAPPNLTASQRCSTCADNKFSRKIPGRSDKPWPEARSQSAFGITSEASAPHLRGGSTLDSVYRHEAKHTCPGKAERNMC